MSNPAISALMTGRVVPVVVIEDATKAQPVGQALLRGGINCAEVTLRTPAALEAIRHMATNADLLVGAGTVVRPTRSTPSSPPEPSSSSPQV